MIPLLIGLAALVAVIVAVVVLRRRSKGAMQVPSQSVIVNTPNGPAVVTQEIPPNQLVTTPSGQQVLVPPSEYPTPKITPIPPDVRGQEALERWLKLNELPPDLQFNPVPPPVAEPKPAVPMPPPPPPPRTPAPPPRIPARTPAAPPPPPPPMPTPSATPAVQGGTGSQYSADEATAMLRAHNTRRAAKGTPVLTWDSSLASFAQEWAENLKARNIPLEHRSPNQFGENLAWDSGLQMNPEQVLTGWVEDEEPFYNHATGQCQGGVCGHATQVWWRDTQRVGCGRARNGRQQWVVCNYDPPGNIRGRKPY